MQRIQNTIDNEEARLNALRDLGLLDTPPSETFDRLTRLASQLLSAPVSTVSLTDRDRQWFKSKVGVDITEIPREQAHCSYAIEGKGVFVVPDLAADPRFAGSPLVNAGIRFYAGAPLVTRSGHGLGTICVVDGTPRTLAEGEDRKARFARSTEALASASASTSPARLPRPTSRRARIRSARLPGGWGSMFARGGRSPQNSGRQASQGSARSCPLGELAADDILIRSC